MLLVLDSNEYLSAVGLTRKIPCARLLDVLIERYPIHRIRIPRLIVTEVRRHLSPQAFKEWLTSMLAVAVVDEDFDVPFELGAKYEMRGLKPADAFIAAYTEWVGAELLVSENRHFLTRHADLPFQVLTAEQALKKIS